MASHWWLKFDFKAWADDVKRLSITARGLLIELCIEMPKCGGEMEIDVPEFCRLSGGLTEQVNSALNEFRKYGIFDFEARGGGKEFIISRRVKKKIAQSEKNRENGKKGGNPELLKKKKVTKRLTDTVKPTVNQTDNQPSYSYSNSNSDSITKDSGGLGEKGEKKSRSRKKSPQDDSAEKTYPIPTLDDVREYCTEKGFENSAFQEQVFDYYNELKWHDKNGEPVKNWKSKIRSVWLTPENAQKYKSNQLTTNGSGNRTKGRVDQAVSREERDAFNTPNEANGGGGGITSFHTES